MAGTGRIFDCHSHWGTKRGYIFRTEEQLAQQEKIWNTKASFFTEEEMVAYFRNNGATVILDLSFTKFLPIEEMREHHDYAFALQRHSADAIFGHWLQFEPHRALESIREFDRALAANAGFIGLCVNGQVTRVPASDPLTDHKLISAFRLCSGAPATFGASGFSSSGSGIGGDNGPPAVIE